MLRLPEGSLPVGESQPDTFAYCISIVVDVAPSQCWYVSTIGGAFAAYSSMASKYYNSLDRVCRQVENFRGGTYNHDRFISSWLWSTTYHLSPPAPCKAGHWIDRNVYDGGTHYTYFDIRAYFKGHYDVHMRLNIIGN